MYSFVFIKSFIQIWRWSERYEFVLNALFYWEPVEFFQKCVNWSPFVLFCSFFSPPFFFLFVCVCFVVFFLCFLLLLLLVCLFFFFLSFFVVVVVACFVFALFVLFV